MNLSDACSRAPLAMAGVMAVTGILLAELQPSTLGTWAGLTLVCVAVACAPWAAKLPRWVWILPLVACVFGGRHQQRRAETFEHPLLKVIEGPGWAATGVPVTVEGRLLRSYGAVGAPVRQSDLAATRVAWADGSRVWEEPCVLRVLHPAGQPPPGGDHCRIDGLLRPLAPPLNEAEFDTRDYALRSGMVAQLAATRVEGLGESWVGTLPRRLRDAAEACRQSIRERLSRGLEDQPAELSVIQAMVLGSAEETDPRIEDDFRRSGTLHVFAVSGLHVSLVCLIFYQLLRVVGLRRGHRLVVLVVLVFGYAYLTGWRPSAARAALMITVVLASASVQRRSSLVNTLGGAGVALLFFDTHQLFQAGFQLSFGVLLAIGLLAGLFLGAWRSWVELDPFLPPALATGSQRAGVWLRGQGAGLLGVSLAAWLGSLPLMWHHFQTVTPAGILANCLLVPLAFFCLALASLSLVASLVPLAASVQVLLNQTCAFFASLMMSSADGFASIPGGNLHVPSLTRSRDASEVELRCLALPRGAEAMILRVGKAHWMLDCGSESGFGSVVLPTLRCAGINRLDGVFLSHADAGHVGGAEGLLRSLEVGELLHGAHEPWLQDGGQSRLRRLLGSAGGDGVELPPVRTLLAGEVVTLADAGRENTLRPARLTVLYPGPADRFPQADDRGVVGLVELGPLRVLWMADAGITTEAALLRRGVDVRCDVLVRGAREGDIHGTSAFLEAADPALIISAGETGEAGRELPTSVSYHAMKRGIPLHLLPSGGELILRLASPAAREVRVHRFLRREPMVVPLRR